MWLFLLFFYFNNEELMEGGSMDGHNIDFVRGGGIHLGKKVKLASL